MNRDDFVNEITSLCKALQELLERAVKDDKLDPQFQAGYLHMGKQVAQWTVRVLQRYIDDEEAVQKVLTPEPGPGKVTVVEAVPKKVRDDN